MEITAKTTLTELAAIISEALESNNIIATLSGGAVVSIYSENRYQSADLDFVTTALIEELKVALEPLGFRHSGNPRLSVFEHPETIWYVEFPPAPLGFGGTYVNPSSCALIKTDFGNLRIITPTQSVMDRLIAAVAWNEPQSLEQALLVVAHQIDKIDWEELDRWVINEDFVNDREIIEFYRKSERVLPV
jgi:hypothetical protein